MVDPSPPPFPRLFQPVCNEVQREGPSSVRRFTARIGVPGGWLYRTELTFVGDDPGHVAVAVSTAFVPEAGENVPRGTK